MAGFPLLSANEMFRKTYYSICLKKCEGLDKTSKVGVKYKIVDFNMNQEENQNIESNIKNFNTNLNAYRYCAHARKAAAANARESTLIREL